MNAFDAIDRLRRQLADLEVRIAQTGEPDRRNSLIQEAAQVEQQLVSWEIEAAGQ